MWGGSLNMMKTKQIVFTGVNKAEFIDAEYAVPQATEVIVRIEYSAISNGTEKANIQGMRNGTNVKEGETAEFPRYCGYSAAGVVVDKGCDVTDINIGDRVVVFWGYHKKFITIDQENVMKIPEGVSMEEAAMAHIATFPLAAIRKTRLEIGESAMVMGLGILGIFAINQLKACGAMPIIAVDPVEERREFALKMGADFALDPTADNFCDIVKEITFGGVNVVIEVTGLGVGMVQALDCMKKFGRISLLGCTRNSDFNVDYYSKVHAPGITIVGAHTAARPNESFPGYWSQRDELKTILELIKGKRLNFKDMICEIHTPDEAPDVYTRLVNDKTFPIGVLFDWTQTK